MKLHVDTHVATGEGFESVADFSIEMNEKAFTVLSDTIYKDKIGSIVRELSCNAYDAHVDAGTPDKPFEIHLPDAFEPYFSIRDYGKGISPADIKDIYTKYFASTKDQSNDVVGAFGLGSKTPFAYTDAFTVISIHGGIKTMYNAHKSRGLPAIVAYGESEPTDEPNGLEIRVSVEGMDYKGFQAAVKRQLKFFDVKPVIANGEIAWETYKPLLEVDGFVYYTINGARDGHYYNRDKLVTAGLFVKQGPVAYPIDFDTLNQVLDSKGIERSPFYTYLQQSVNTSYSAKGIIIDMPIGTVEVTASREGISYKDTTVENIMKRLEQITRTISREVVAKLDSSYKNGVLEFITVLEELDSYFKHSLVAADMEKRYPKFEFTDSTSGVRAYFKVPTATFQDVEIRKYDIVNYQQPRATHTYTLTASLVNPNDKSSKLRPNIRLDLRSIAGREDRDGNKNVVFIKDIPNGFIARLKEYNKSNTVILLEVPNGVTKDDIAKGLGDDFTVRMVSELPKVAVKSRAGQGGHSITGGRQRLWFNIDTNDVEKIFDGDDTCYSVGCPQVFGESFDEAEDDLYAYFTTFNNKVDRKVVNFTDDEGLGKLFCEWLQTKGYKIVAVAGGLVDKAVATDKFFCINKLWYKNEEVFKKEAWTMFLDTIKSNYYYMLMNEYGTEGWGSHYSFATFNTWFRKLDVKENEALNEKFVMLQNLSNGKSFSNVSYALQKIVTMDKSLVENFTTLNNALGSRGSAGSLHLIETIMTTCGVKLEVVGSELVEGYIKLLKEHIVDVISVSAVTGKLVDMNRLQLRDPMSRDTFLLTSAQVKDAIVNKLGVGA